MNQARNGNRGLMVLADGVHAAFAAGAVAELARCGVSWKQGAGAGLGAHVALLALLGEAAEAERRWAREGVLGCPMFESRLGSARRSIADSRGLTLLPDPWSLPGWLDPAGLAEHLAPEMAAMPQRLTEHGATLVVAVEDLRSGVRSWLELSGLGPHRAGVALRAAAAFPGGWGPGAARNGERAELLWGGVSAALHDLVPAEASATPWDVVCGFPVPTVARPALGESLIELVQRRTEVEGAARIIAWRDAPRACPLRVLAPTEALYRNWAGRVGADIGVEYPLSWERNGDLTAGLVRFGAYVAGEREAQPVT